VPEIQKVIYVFEEGDWIYGCTDKSCETIIERFANGPTMHRILNGSPIHLYDDDGHYEYEKAIWVTK
jgi:hypothetical protein